VTEDEFQAQVMTLAKHCGWRRVHFRKARTKRGWRTAVAGDGKGFVDLVLVHERRQHTLFVECKSDTGTLYAEQREWGRVLLAAGEDWRCWRPRDWPEVERVLKGG
jgi:hypothetical protein